MTVLFTVPIPPFGKQRPRHNRRTGVTYTPIETKKHERMIAEAYKALYDALCFDESAFLRVEVTAYYPIPKSASKRKRTQMLMGEIRPTVKPDWDNVGKLITDALNGVAYPDDKQIVTALINKQYAVVPRMEIRITDELD